MEKIIGVALTIFFASFIHGLAGFGGALIAVSLLTLFLPLRVVTPLIILGGLVITLYIVLRLRRHFDFFKMVPLLLGSVVGAPLGVFLLVAVNETVAKTVLGVLLFIYALYSLIVKMPEGTLLPRWGYLFGFISGALGGAYGTGGPPAVIYTSMQPWDKEEILITLQSYFLILGVIIAGLHLANGLIDSEVLTYWFVLLPVQFLGVFAGLKLNERVERDTFRKIVYLLLLAISILLLLNALTVI
jgi:uncharacterized membrane protein YfcA